MVYSVGDRVWLFMPATPKGLKPKMLQRWDGPYTVVNADRVTHTYKLRDRNFKTLPSRIQQRRLKPCHDPALQPKLDPVSDDEGDTATQDPTSQDNSDSINVASPRRGDVTGTPADPDSTPQTQGARAKQNPQKQQSDDVRINPPSITGAGRRAKPPAATQQQSDPHDTEHSKSNELSRRNQGRGIVVAEDVLTKKMLISKIIKYVWYQRARHYYCQVDGVGRRWVPENLMPTSMKASFHARYTADGKRRKRPAQNAPGAQGAL